MPTLIRTAEPVAASAMLGLGVYRPERVVTNEEICQHIDSTDEWIQSRSGIKNRRFAAEGETVIDMSVAAARKALDASGIEADQLDCVIVATLTHTQHTPAAAPRVADRLGSSAAAFDLSAACAGFCHGLALASDMVRGGTAAYVLVVGAERMSQIVDPTDRGTAFIFGDGAGAVVVGRADVAGIGPVAWGSDGSQHDVIAQHPECDLVHEGPKPVLHMEGTAVFRWAAFSMGKVAQEALDLAGVDVENLDAFVPHQANLRIVDMLTKSLNVPEHVPVARDIIDSGNTSAASIPLAMDTMLRNGEAKPGDTALLIGFGAGLSYAGQVVALPAFA
ncbi:beta-ketoacyl-ACP synthase III [Luteipulveratus mongoliensis]